MPGITEGTHATQQRKLGLGLGLGAASRAYDRPWESSNWVSMTNGIMGMDGDSNDDDDSQDMISTAGGVTISGDQSKL